MFPQFGATAESLSKASSLVLRIGTDAHLYDDPDDVSIAPLLDSKFDSEKSEALKRLLALIAQGADVSNFFPQVVKNVASQSLEVKKLVYLYLLHYAEKRPNEALLSINCFQKDLSDTNPLVRAWALRAMAGIRLHVVAPLVLVAIGKCARDPSPYVRKCAAHALPKLFDLHQEENASLEEIINILLNDNSPGVVGAAAVAFRSVCPNNLSLIGKNFKRLCETLPDVEEWGQIVLMEILLRYVVARHGLVKESVIFTSSSTLSSEPGKSSNGLSQTFDISCGPIEGDVSDFKLNMSMYRYYFEGQEYLSGSGYNGDEDKLNCAVLTSSQNDDVKILLRCTSPLLWSQNSAVVLAAAGVHWIMASKEDVKRIAKPLLFILRSSHASKYVVLCNIQMFAKADPLIFAPYFEDFFICSSDLYQMRALKLEILSTIATESSVPVILEEFEDYIRDPDRRFVADTVAAIGLCAQKLPTVATICLEGLLALTIQESFTHSSDQMDGEGGVLVQAVMSIKVIIKQNPSGHEKVIVRLARNLDAIKEPAARSLIVWMVGEYCSVGQMISKIVPHVLQYLAWSFISEELETKHQILNTTAKVVLCAQEKELFLLRKILSYIIELAKCDLDYDVRDRARLVENLIYCHIPSLGHQEGTSSLLQNGGICREFVENIFKGRMLSAKNPGKDYRFYLPGSLSHIVLHAAPGYGPLPKPCSLLDIDLSPNSVVASEGEVHGVNSDSFEMNDPGASSGSSIEESGSSYDSQHSIVSSVDSEGTGFANDSDDNGLIAIHSAGDDKENPLVHFPAGGADDSQSHRDAVGNISASMSTDLAEMMSKTALESWLDEQSSLSSVQKSGQPSSARISINDAGLIIKPKVYMLLDPTNGNGLKVEYSFSSEISTISPLLVCVEVLFENCSTEPLTKISLKDGESDGNVDSAVQVFDKTESSRSDANDEPSILPMEEITSLDPDQTIKVVIQVRFHHHLLPIKLAVFCNGKRHLTKLWPDIGYFIRPLSMNVDVFVDKQSQLRGMFECVKRCTFTKHIGDLDCEGQSSVHTDKILVVSRSLASRVLSNANLYLVSMDMPVSFNIDDASGLCLRFSGETLSSLKPCLITLLTEGKCSEPLSVTVKVNCEETIFALNLLNRVVAFLS